MVRKSFLSLLLFAITFLTVQAQDKTFANMDVFELEWAADPQISPDGKHIVYQRRGMDKMTDRRTSRLWSINSDGSGHMKLTDDDKNEVKSALVARRQPHCICEFC
ncbi:MAG: hypothetical protein U5J95_01050 [Balneolaceae bacterium]|nr:hypothetical protein [Balneolaceae bacterium]